MKFLRKLLAYRATPLPFGVTEFEAWASDIIYLFDLPDNDSIRFSLASTIMHYPSANKENTKAFAKAPKAFFGNMIRKTAANQVAGFIMQELKAKQQAEATKQKEAEEAAAKAAAEQPSDNQDTTQDTTQAQS
jgi:hypothetical protein